MGWDNDWKPRSDRCPTSNLFHEDLSGGGTREVVKVEIKNKQHKNCVIQVLVGKEDRPKITEKCGSLKL